MDISTTWYSCSTCKAVFPSRTLLQNHKKAEHPKINSQPKKSKNLTVNPGVIQTVNKQISSQNNNNNNNNITTSRLQQNGYQDISFNSQASSSSSSSYRYSQQQQHRQMPNIYREFSSSTITPNNSLLTTSTSETNVQAASNIIRLKGASNNFNLSTSSSSNSSSNGSYSNTNNNSIISNNKYDGNLYKTNDTTISNNYSNNQYKTDSTHMAEPSIISKKRKVIETVSTIMKEKINTNIVEETENVVNWRTSSSLTQQQNKKFKIENYGNTNESQINTASRNSSNNNNNNNNNKNSVNMDFDMDMNVDVKYEEYLYCDRCNEKFVTVEQLSVHYRMCNYPEKSNDKIKSYQQHHHHLQQQLLQQQQNVNSNSTGRYQNENFTSPPPPSLQSYSSSSFSNLPSSLPVSSSSSPYLNLKLNLSNDREDEPTVDPLSIPISVSNYSPSATYFSPTSKTTTRNSTSSLSSVSSTTRITPSSTAKIPCLYCGRLFQFEREAKIHELSHINNLSITGDTMTPTIFPGLYTTSSPTVGMPTTTITHTPSNHFSSLNSTYPLSLPPQIPTPHFLLQQPTPSPLLWTHHGLILNDPVTSINPNSQPFYTPSTLSNSLSSDFPYFPRLNYSNPGIGIPMNLLPTTTTNTTNIPTNITPLAMPNGTKNMSKNKNNNNSSNSSSNSHNNNNNNNIPTSSSSSPYFPFATSGQISSLVRGTPISTDNNNTKTTEYYPRRNRTKSLLPKIPNNNLPQVSSSINLQNNKNNAQLSTGIIRVNNDDSNDSIKSSSSSHSSNTNVHVPSIPISVVPIKSTVSNTQIVDQEPQTTRGIQSTVTPYYPKRNRTKNLIPNGKNTNNNTTTSNKGHQNQSFNSNIQINSSSNSSTQQLINSDNDIIYLSTTTTTNNNNSPMHINNDSNNNNNNNNKQLQAGGTTEGTSSGITIKCNSGSIPLTVFVPRTVITPQVSIATTISSSSSNNNNNNNSATTNGIRLNNNNNSNNNENDEDDLVIDVTNSSPTPPPSQTLSTQSSSSSSQPQFNCSSCTKSYSSEKALETHKTSVHRREKPFQCPDCPKKFSHVKQLEFHALSHPSKSEKCKHCSSAFWSKTNLKEHMKEFHKNFGYMNDTDEDDIDEDGELIMKIK